MGNVSTSKRRGRKQKWTKQPSHSQVACISDDLRCWGTWDTIRSCRYAENGRSLRRYFRGNKYVEKSVFYRKSNHWCNSSNHMHSQKKYRLVWWYAFQLSLFLLSFWYLSLKSVTRTFKLWHQPGQMTGNTCCQRLQVFRVRNYPHWAPVLTMWPWQQVFAVLVKLFYTLFLMGELWTCPVGTQASTFYCLSADM